MISQLNVWHNRKSLIIEKDNQEQNVLKNNVKWW